MHIMTRWLALHQLDNISLNEVGVLKSVITASWLLFCVLFKVGGEKGKVRLYFMQFALNR